jgi:protein-disulfide isomerase
MLKPVATLLALLLLACPAKAADNVVATVDGTNITRSELEKLIRPQLIELDNNRYQLMRGALESLIALQLLEKEAAAREISEGELEQIEITAKLTPPTDEEITQVYEASKAQLGEASLDDVRARIAEFITEQQARQHRTELVIELRKKFTTKVMLEIPRIDISDAGRASRGGGKDAPIQIIAFSDYECPYCRDAEDTLKQVLEKYGDKIRYVLRDYPLPFHAFARDAARAARCAGEQDKFWDYSDGLWGAEGLDKEQLADLADALKLDRDKFDACLDSDKYDTSVDEDLAAGTELGVSGTPAFFVNGRMLTGAQPFEMFVSLIDEELGIAAN